MVGHATERPDRKMVPEGRRKRLRKLPVDARQLAAT
jgi:hypothetical protein